MDKRKTLLDCGISSIRLGENVFYLDSQKKVGKGGTCLVYYAEKRDRLGMPRKVMLKEFYPLLDFREGGEITRSADGTLMVPEAVKQSELYQVKQERFCTSYESFKYFFNEDSTNNYVLQGQEIYHEPERGTIYMVVDYSSSMSLAEYMEQGPSLYEFLSVLKMTAKAAGKFHQKNYIHLDLKPENILVYPDGYVKFMDVDSVMKKEDFYLEGKEFYVSVSDGYTAPEVISYDSRRLYERRRFAERGEASDIYSIGAVLYAYLYENPLKLLAGHGFGLDRGRKKQFLQQRVYEASLEDRIREKYGDCPRKAVRLLKELLRYTLTDLTKDRISSMDLLIKQIDEILPLTEPKTVRLEDSFRGNPYEIYGRDGKIREMEKKIRSQRGKGSRILCISGVGGIGKSTLARAFAEKYEEEYDFIIEVSSAGAKEAIGLIGLVPWKEEWEEDISPEQLWNQKYRKIKECMAEAHVLLLVHDYNVSEDADFSFWWELGCDIVLTSWNDWSRSGIDTISLKTEDLSEEKEPAAAKRIFSQFYLQNAKENGDQEWEKELAEILKEEERYLEQLLKQLNYHPLGIKLMAKQMSYVPGAEIGPLKMLEGFSELKLDSEDEFDFQNERDHQILDRNMYGHLKKILEKALAKDRISEKERETLRYMTIVHPQYGISAARFEEWTGCSARYLEKLSKKGWIEFLAGRKDVLSLEKRCRGVYAVPTLIGEVLFQEVGKSTIANSEVFIEHAMASVNRYKDYSGRTAFCEQQQRLIHILEKEESAEYAWLLSVTARSLHDTDGSAEAGRKCISYYERALKIHQNLPKEYLKDVVTDCNNLSVLHYEMGNAKMVEFYTQLSLKAHHDCGEPENENTILTLINLGGLFLTRGENEKALDWHKEACERSLTLHEGRDSVLLAHCLSQLGYTYFRLGDWEPAEEVLVRACDIFLKSANYLSYAKTLEHTAKLRSDIDDPELSRKCQETVFHFYETYLGPEHLDTLVSQVRLGSICVKCGDFKEGLRFHKEAADKMLVHPKCQTHHKAFACLMTALDYEITGGDEQDFVTYLFRAFELYSSIHHQEIKTLNDICRLYVSFGKKALEEGTVQKGLEFYETALEIEERFLKPGDLLEEYIALAGLFGGYGYWGRSKMYQRRAGKLK